jgi:hypothetical protein
MRHLAKVLCDSRNRRLEAFYGFLLEKFGMKPWRLIAELLLAPPALQLSFALKIAPAARLDLPQDLRVRIRRCR